MAGMVSRGVIYTEHDRSIWGIHVQPDDVTHLVDEQRVLGEFERFYAMRLKRRGMPDPADGGLRHARRLG